MRIRLARVWGLSLLSIVLGLALAGAAGAGEVSLRFNDAEHKEMREALDVFQRQNPNIKVVLQRIAWGDAREQFLREAAVGQGPDIGHFAQVMVRSMGAGRGLPQAERPGARSTAWKSLEDGLPLHGPRQPRTTARSTAIPWTVDTFAMVYNKDLLQQAGITKFPETWEELRQASRQIKAKTGKIGWAFPAGQRRPRTRSGSSATSTGGPTAGRWWTGRPTASTSWPSPWTRSPRPSTTTTPTSRKGTTTRRCWRVTNWGAQELIEGMVSGEHRDHPHAGVRPHPDRGRLQGPLPGQGAPVRLHDPPEGQERLQDLHRRPPARDQREHQAPGRGVQARSSTSSAPRSTRSTTSASGRPRRACIAKIERPPSHSGYAEQLKLARPGGPTRPARWRSRRCGTPWGAPPARCSPGRRPPRWRPRSCTT